MPLNVLPDTCLARSVLTLGLKNPDEALDKLCAVTIGAFRRAFDLRIDNLEQLPVIHGH